MFSRKKIIIITLVVLIILFVGLLVYWLLFKQKPEVSPESFFNNPEEILTTDESNDFDNDFVRLTKESVAGFTLINDKVLTLGFDGKLKSIDPVSGQQQDVFNFSLDGVVSAEFSPLGDIIAVKILNSNNQKTRWILVNIKETKIQSLDTNIINVSFSPNGTLALLRDMGNWNYEILTKVADKESSIYSLILPDPIIKWVNDKTIALATKPSGIAPGILYFLDIKTKQQTRILGNIFGFSFVSSSKNNWLAYSETNIKGNNVSLKRFLTGNSSGLNTNILSLPEKCVFSKNKPELICGSFGSNPSNIIMPDSYYKGVFSPTMNDLVKTNLETGSVDFMKIDLQADVLQPILSNDESMIIFKDKNTGAIFRLNISN